MCMEFPGQETGDLAIDLDTLDLGALGAVSFSMWWNANVSGAGDEQVVLAKGDETGNDDPWKFQFESDDFFRTILDTGAGGDVLESSGALNDSQWYHTVLVYDGSDKFLYLDGVLDNTEAQTGSLVTGGGEQVYIAAVEAGGVPRREFDGFIDDVRIYDRALTPAEVLTIYTLLGRDRIFNGLIHRWRMVEGSPGVAASGVGTTKDSGSGQFNGEPINSPTWEEGILRI